MSADRPRHNRPSPQPSPRERSRAGRKGPAEREGEGRSLQIQLQNRCFRSGAADQHIAPAAVLVEDLVAMIGLAGKVGCQAGSAITELAGGAHSDAVTA